MRCPICDDNEGPFVKDPFNNDHVCLSCADSIQETSGSDWAEEDLLNDFPELAGLI